MKNGCSCNGMISDDTKTLYYQDTFLYDERNEALGQNHLSSDA